LANLTKLDLRFEVLPRRMTVKTYLAFVKFSNVEDFRNFGGFVFLDQNMVQWKPLNVIMVNVISRLL
jgi:hypothetical protein